MLTVAAKLFAIPPTNVTPPKTTPAMAFFLPEVIGCFFEGPAFSSIQLNPDYYCPMDENLF